jgi:exodeoxyribonuclease VII small subunit
MTEPIAISFEDGYRRLQAIAEEVNQTEVPVDRMGDLFAEGRGLEKALTDHLTAQKARIERIEKGDEIQAFHITSENGKSTKAPDPRADTSDASGEEKADGEPLF